VRVRSRHTKYNVLNDFNVNRFGLLDKRNVALGKRNVALDKRNVALGKRNVALGLRNVALGKINVILGKNVANVVLGKKKSRNR
jgi:hypothetical protein